MSWVIVTWSMTASACLMLALVHALIWWWRRREALANALFALLAVATILFSACEIWMMRAGTVEEFGRAIWWSHLPAFIVVISLVGFVRIHLRAGRPWLAWAICGVRALALLLNFFSTPNINYREITALHHVQFLGETISVAVGVSNPWMLVGQADLLLLVCFVLDAALTVWRRADPWRARLLSMAITFFVVMGTGQLVLVVWGLIERPLMPSLFFFGVILAMGVELGYDLLRATKLAEDLKESEARMNLAAEAAGFGVWMWNLAGNQVWGSENWLRLHGFDRGESVEFDQVTQRIHPDDREQVRREMQSRLAGQADYAGEYRVLLPDGTQKWIASRGRIHQDAQGIPGRMLGAAIDITERKRAEAALRQSEAKYRKIFENVQEVFYQTDNQGAIIEVSPSIERYSGFRREELIGQPVEEVYYDKEDRARLLKILGEKGEVADHELRLKTKTGCLVYASVNAHVLLGADGKPAGVEGALRDITERKRAEAALQESEQQLRQSQKLEAIGQLAGGVAHDFNNILASTLMQVDLIGFAENLPAAVKEGLEHIRADAERAARLTRQLLLFSRRQTMLPQILNLNDQVVSLVKMLQRIIGEDVHLELHLHAAPLLTHADAGMLDQVLMNLVVNARDAMPAGGRLRIETGEETVTTDQPLPHPEAVPGHFVCLAVSDTGSGIPPEILPRIFEPFFTTKTEGKGTGLGLATVYGIVKQHQGWIQVVNRPSQGVTFRVFLPASATPMETASSDTKFRARRGTETILLVEDEPGLLKVTRAILVRQGYRVLTATNGPEALSLWREHRGTVALLLTDLVMPGGMSGQELGRQLRADQPQLKVIFSSGYSAEIAGRELPLHRGENFLQKPYAPGQLLKVVRQSLDG